MFTSNQSNQCHHSHIIQYFIHQSLHLNFSLECTCICLCGECERAKPRRKFSRLGSSSRKKKRLTIIMNGKRRYVNCGLNDTCDKDVKRDLIVLALDVRGLLRLRVGDAASFWASPFFGAVSAPVFMPLICNVPHRSLCRDVLHCSSVEWPPALA